VKLNKKPEVYVRCWDVTEEKTSTDAGDTGAEAGMDAVDHAAESTTTTSSKTDVGEVAKEVSKKHPFTCFITVPGIGSSTGSGQNPPTFHSCHEF
jgi:hypothetical protein